MALGCADPPPPPVPAPIVITGAPSPPPAVGFADDEVTIPDVPAPTTGGTTADSADDGPSPPIPTGIAQQCISVCDCPAGLSCLEGICQATLEVRWCCTDPFCPAGTRCETPDGRISSCR
jgi:hypothetical protein